MKFVIVGLHGSGKSDVIDILEKWGVNCGHNFSDIPVVKDSIYGSKNYELYTTKDINEVFENDAYIFMQEKKYNDCKYYEGLSKYSFDNNSVFSLSPDQLLVSSFNSIQEPICFVWLDSTKNFRYNKYQNDKRNYNFNLIEELETADLSEFVKIIYSQKHLYFTNEEPSRIAAVVYSIIQHEDLLPIFLETYN
jgi:hypothetical protein